MEETIISFLQMIEPLKSTLRHNWTKSGRQESVAEHTWRMAIFFILIQELQGTDVDPYRTLKMILIHDIPELIHGDIPAFMKHVDPKKHAEHKAREMQSAEKIFNTLPDALRDEFIQLHKEYDEGTSKEAKIAKALDRLESQLQHLDSGPKYWSDEEKGEPMLTYPNQALQNLNDHRFSRIWEIIKKEVEEITYPKTAT